MNYRIFNRLHSARNIFFIAVAFFGSLTSIFAQTHISVAPVKMNVLYIGIDNPVSVAAAGAADEKVTVSITGGGGTVSKINTGLYNVRVTNATDDCILNVYVDGKLAGTSRFRVRQMPYPSAIVGGIKSGVHVAANYFRSQNGLSVFIENFPFEMKYEVTGFSVVLVDDKGNILTLPCQGSLFSEKAKQCLQQYLKSGDIVTFENIRAKAEDGAEFKLPSLLYHIK